MVELFPRPGGALEQWRAGWRALEELIERSQGRFGLLADARQAGPPSALERRVVTEFFHRREPELRGRCAGLAVAVSNPVVRAAATAVFWVARPPMEVQVERDLGVARAWLEGRLDVGARTAG